MKITIGAYTIMCGKTTTIYDASLLVNLCLLNITEDMIIFNNLMFRWLQVDQSEI